MLKHDVEDVAWGILRLGRILGEGDESAVKVATSLVQKHIVQELAELTILDPISTAPTDGTPVMVYVDKREELPGFICVCTFHEDAGWCADEIRPVTHWVRGSDVAIKNYIDSMRDQIK